MKKTVKITLAALAALAAVGICYYVMLPPINIHAPGFWCFVILLSIAVTVLYGLFHIAGEERGFVGKVAVKRLVFYSKKERRILIALAGVTLGLILFWAAGAILSSTLVNARAYHQLLTVETRAFATDIKEISYAEIPLLDKASAEIIGNRVMGTMVDMVSQFEVENYYTQINYNGKPYRVTPLKYGNLIKWLANSGEGIPAYIKIDMTTQEAECVRLAEEIKYSTSDHFGRNIYRHLRFAYPTYIFDDLSFEIDDGGTPYWICPVKKYNIGLFGGVTIGKVVLCNAITGEMQDYDIQDVPQWVDHVYSAQLLIELYDYNGLLKNGFFNSVFSQKGCLQTTDGYNYIALGNDVWVYTGVTSMGRDKSNVGFVLMNQRTAETRYYEVAGAEEYSAMESAEGKVQHLGYTATFPLVLNIEGQPTYFMALKDGAGLVKQYAMLNIEKYQTVAIGDTVLACEREYVKILEESGIITGTKNEPPAEKEAAGIITKLAQMVVDGNTHFYVQLDNGSDIYDISFAEIPMFLNFDIGDYVKIECIKQEPFFKVTKLKDLK